MVGDLVVLADAGEDVVHALERLLRFRRVRHLDMINHHMKLRLVLLKNAS